MTLPWRRDPNAEESRASSSGFGAEKQNGFAPDGEEPLDSCRDGDGTSVHGEPSMPSVIGGQGPPTVLPSVPSQPTPSGRGDNGFRDYLKNNRGAAVFALLVAILSLVASAIFLTKSPKPTPPSHEPEVISNAASLGKSVSSQSVWHPSSSVTTFTISLKIAFAAQATANHRVSVELNGAGTDIETHSVTEVAQNGAGFRGRVLMIVGRVRSTYTSPTQWKVHGALINGPNHNIELESPDGKEAVPALVEGQVSHGQVVYFPCVVVAVGIGPLLTYTSYVVGVAAAKTIDPSFRAVKVLLFEYIHHRH
jgi:hypothetical protein